MTCKNCGFWLSEYRKEKNEWKRKFIQNYNLSCWNCEYNHKRKTKMVPNLPSDPETKQLRFDCSNCSNIIFVLKNEQETRTKE